MALAASPRKVAATATANATLAKGRHTPVNVTGGSVTMTLPTGAAEGVPISLEKIDASANQVTISGNIRGVAGSTIALATQYAAASFVADSAGSWWPVGGSSAGGGGLADGGVTTTKLADGAVTPAKLDNSTAIEVLYTGTAWPSYSTDPNKIRRFRSAPYPNAPAPTAYNIYDGWEKN